MHHDRRPTPASPPPKSPSPLRVILAVVAAGAILAFAYLALDRAREHANRVHCTDNLRQIAVACLEYADANGGRFPNTLGQLGPRSGLDPAVFRCPNAGRSPHVYVGKGLTAGTRPAAIVAYEPLENHAGRGINVVYTDAGGDWLAPDEARRVIAELQLGHNPPRPRAGAALTRRAAPPTSPGTAPTSPSPR